ncbi:MAG: hypothetical protein O3C57_02355 [Verrucomicrobia bacterium]|nr:hypothetical protein [Verrucomicrobiota bacterium]
MSQQEGGGVQYRRILKNKRNRNVAGGEHGQSGKNSKIEQRRKL